MHWGAPAPDLLRDLAAQGRTVLQIVAPATHRARLMSLFQLGLGGGHEGVVPVRSCLDHLDVMAERGESHGRDEPDVPGSDDQDPLDRCVVHRRQG